MPKRKRKTEEVFHVEVITKARVVLQTPDSKDKKKKPQSDWEYYVKWAGYDSDANSWEPHDNVESCQRLLESFWNHIGTDNNDYFPGYEVSASSEWIEMEKKFFAREYQNSLAEKKRKKEETRPKKKTKKASREPSASAASTSTSKARKVVMVMSEDESSESSTEEGPLKQSHPSPEIQQSLKIKLPPPTKKRKTIVSSSSSDEEPLSKVSRPKTTPKGQTGDASNNEVIEIPSSPSLGSPLFSDHDMSTSESTLTKKPKPTSSVKASMPPNKSGRHPTTNPQGSIAGMSPSEIPAVGGISTKQRVAHGALAPTLPKEIIPPKPPRPQPKPNINNRSTLSQLSFKKRIYPQDTFNMGELAPNLSLPRNVPNEPTLSSLNSPLAQSPTSAVFSPNNSFPSPVLPLVQRRTSLPEPTVSPAMVFQTPVDELLQSFMPESLAAPMNDDAIEQPVELQPPKAINLRIPLPGRTKKEWKWTGPLFLNTETALCNVKIHNLTQETTLRFSIILQDKERIEVPSLYDIADIRCILLAFRKPSQMAQLSPSEDRDVQAFSVLACYMYKARKAFLVPIILDNNVIGQVLCIPYSFCRPFFLEDPPDVYHSYPPGHLVAIILPYTLSQSQLRSYDSRRTPSALPKSVQYTTNDDQWRCSMRTNPQYHRALNMLDFPRNLLEYVGDPEYSRPYAIWTGRETGNSAQRVKEGMETRLLESILNNVKAKKASSIRSEFRLLFIHAGALRTIHQLPGFVERRAKQQHIQFYLYGSDPDISSSQWSVTEVWPCGGIATFTPSAMLSNPAGAYNLISQISRHPIWACYILPSALGMLANMECGTEDPLKAFDEHKLSIDLILEAIEEGDVALIEAPPELPTVKPDDDVHAQWLSKYIAFTPPTKREALEMGVKAFKALQDPSKIMEQEITANMFRVQRHPAFMAEYRRYVVVCSDKDVTKVNTHSDGFEWTTTAKFDFMDEYFPKQIIGGQ